MRWTAEDWAFLQDAVNSISRGAAIIDRLLAKATSDEFLGHTLPHGYDTLHLGDARDMARNAAASAQMAIDAHREELVRRATAPDGDPTVAVANAARQAAESPGLAGITTAEALDECASRAAAATRELFAATPNTHLRGDDANAASEPTGEFAPATTAEPPPMSFLEREAEDILIPAFHIGLAERGPDGLVRLVDPSKVAPPSGGVVAPPSDDDAFEETLAHIQGAVLRGFIK